MYFQFHKKFSPNYQYYQFVPNFKSNTVAAFEGHKKWHFLTQSLTSHLHRKMYSKVMRKKKIVKRMCDKLGPQFPVHCQTSKCRKYLCEKKMMMQKYFFKASKKSVLKKKLNGLHFVVWNWIFGNFPATQNLREINFRSSKNAIYAILETLNFDFLVLFSLHKSKFR